MIFTVSVSFSTILTSIWLALSSVFPANTGTSQNYYCYDYDYDYDYDDYNDYYDYDYDDDYDDDDDYAAVKTICMLYSWKEHRAPRRGLCSG